MSENYTSKNRTIILPNSAWWRIDWQEIWEYRDLLFLLVKRDLTAVYKQSALGPLWFVIQPLVTTLVFTVIFGNVAKISTDGIPHFVFYMSGTVFWNYFAGILNQSGGALVTNAGILSKVYFPRLIIPLSGLISQLAHFALNSVMFLVIYIWFLFKGSTMEPNSWLGLLPALIVQCAFMGLGFGLWVSALTIKYRDLKFAMPFVTQIWMYATPIVYPAALIVNPTFKWVLWLNPMTAVVEFSRYGFTGQGSIDLAGYGLSWIVTILVLTSGLLLFNKLQRSFVDTI